MKATVAEEILEPSETVESAEAGAKTAPERVVSAAEIVAAPSADPAQDKAQAESRRLEALRAYEILDTPPEATFDRVTKLAARLFKVPMAAVSLVDADRLWFKSAVGVDVCQIPREMSFCDFALAQTEVMVICDTHLSAAFAQSQLVRGEPFARFYAGAPLVDRQGMVLGTLCLLDTKPREFGAEESQNLADLAAVVVDELELCLAAHQLHQADSKRVDAQKALLDSQKRFKSAFQFSPIGMSLTSPDGTCLQVNQSLCDLLGCTETQLLGGEQIYLTHPDDIEANLHLVRGALAGEFNSYQMEKRYLRADGNEKWCLLSASLVRDDAGAPLYFISQVQDISKRKRIESELRHSEARKTAILETALDCIITIDSNERVIEWNPASERTFGYGREEAIGSFLHDLIVPPEFSAAHSAGMKRYLETGIGPVLGKRLELPAVRSDGTRITVELAIVPIPGAYPPLFTGHLRDISERRATEERLRLLESVAVNANDAIVITGAESNDESTDESGPRIVYANRAFVEMSGYSLEEVIGQSPRMMQGEGTCPASRARIRAALQDWKPIVIEMLNYKKNGTPFWVELSITPIANEKGWFTHWVSIQRDITRSREILDAMRDSEERYGLIASNVPGMVYQFMLAPDGTVSFPFASEGCREIFALEPEELMADARKVTDYVHPDEDFTFRESVRVSAQNLTPWEWEGRIAVADYGMKWIRGTSRPRREAGGVIWDGILIDITGRKTQEELLRSAKIEAEAARQEAEGANLAKSEFLGRMSHELRTPLNAILGFGQLLEMSDLAFEDNESTEQILKAGRHLLDLINEVLDIARIESGHLSLSPEAINVSEVLLETLDLVRALAARRGIVIDDSAIRAGTCFVRADRQRLKQVLLNLVSNAIKYNRENGRVTLSCNPGGGERMRIGVRDEGAGIAPELRPRLFTAFDRLGAENSSVEGTGVGLALSLRLAQAMDGSLDIESEVGKGCLFWIELPCAEDPMTRLDMLHHSSSAASINTKMVVLYIEDNPANLKLVQKLLAHRPEVRLLTAMQGGIGLELAQQHHPDLVLLDMNLPDISGAEVLNVLRSDARTCEIPVVVVSADATDKQIARMKDAGAAHYLTKPFDVREFLGILDANLASFGQWANLRGERALEEIQ